MPLIFAAVYAALTFITFKSPDNLPTLPLPVVDLDLHLGQPFLRTLYESSLSFKWARQPPKLPLSLGDQNPI